MEQQFRAWLISRGYAENGAATSYPSAIHQISEHYSNNTENEIGIYAVNDQSIISQIAHDYSQGGRFAEFGYRQHSRYRAAISRYSEFFVHKNDGSANQNHDNENIGTNAVNEIEPLESRFAYEKDLQTTLCAQISELFQGYKIFGELNAGIEYSIEGKRIDVLLEHIESGDLLAVELKSGTADFRVFGQISMYLGLLQRQFPQKPIGGVIVAGGVDESLKYACETNSNVSLKIYRMSLELENA